MRNELRQLLRESRGTIFTVKFTKLNGQERTLNGRLGVHTKTGRPSSTAHIPKYLTVYDIGNKGFRTVNLDTVTYVATKGMRFVA